jgi:hypothetical protein
MCWIGFCKKIDSFSFRNYLDEDMRRIIPGFSCILFLVLCAYLAAKPEADIVKVHLRVVDAASGKKLSGIVRIIPHTAGKALALPGLLDRFQGVKVPDNIWGWHVLPKGGANLTLPAGKIRIEALAGLETALASKEIDLSKDPPQKIAIKLEAVFQPEKNNSASGNTHLHLMKLTKEQADEYLRQIPAADNLRVMFISYLERHKDDLTYITNRYPIGDLGQFKATGVLFNNGEEHRHNFKAYGQGYGHVMFLNIKELVKPVSLGPGITGSGFDDRALQPGIEDARRQGGAVLWCHNTFGYEDVVNALAGSLHALNVFDGTRKDGYEENYYRYLNIGMHLPISTGTDWFLYDFSRAYVQVPGKLTIPNWLEGLKAGRNVVTNGPLLRLKVDQKNIGDTIHLTEPKTARIEATAVGRNNFERLQLVHNGKVVKTESAAGKNPYRAKLVHQIRIDEPGWLAIRIDSTTKNELGQVLFAHSSPIYLEYQGKNRFDIEAARGLLKQLEEGQAAIRAQGHFSSPQARDRILAMYDQAANELRKRINK